VRSPWPLCWPRSQIDLQVATAADIITDAVGPRQTPAWLTLIAPNGLNGSTVDTTFPSFLWTAVATHKPVSPWTFQIAVSRSSDACPVMTGLSHRHGLHRARAARDEHVVSLVGDGAAQPRAYAPRANGRPRGDTS
jgi:hypothetical protein